MPGPYVYAAADFSPRPAPLGIDAQCVALVRALTGAPDHAHWTQGAMLDAALAELAAGTAIATFIGGVYPSLTLGNHAAVFVRALEDASGYVVFDQWVGRLPQQRTLVFNRPGAHAPSDRGEAFSVIL
jgi:hypothetical protein